MHLISQLSRDVSLQDDIAVSVCVCQEIVLVSVKLQVTDHARLKQNTIFYQRSCPGALPLLRGACTKQSL